MFSNQVLSKEWKKPIETQKDEMQQLVLEKKMFHVLCPGEVKNVCTFRFFWSLNFPMVATFLELLLLKLGSCKKVGADIALGNSVDCFEEVEFGYTGKSNGYEMFGIFRPISLYCADIIEVLLENNC